MPSLSGVVVPSFTVGVVIVFSAYPHSLFQVAVLTAKLEGKDMELESIKEDNGDMLQKVCIFSRAQTEDTIYPFTNQSILFRKVEKHIIYMCM